MSLPLLHAGRTNPGLSPQLDLRFALDKSLTAYRGPTPSFSRASTGSYFDGSGVLRYAVVNQFSYSEQFDNAAWLKNQLSVTANAAIDPLGGSTADKLVEDSSNNYHAIRSTLAATAGTTYTMSVYAKAGERNWLIINPSETGIDDRFTWFNISNGTVGTNATGNTATITPVGNGWYRCSVTRVMAVSNPNWFFEISAVDGVRGYLGNGTSGIFIWGAQLESGSTVGTYCPTTSAANSAPRFNHTYNGTSWVSRGLLVEEQRTNSFSYSQDYSNAYWTKYQVTTGYNTTDTTAPDGTNTATKATSTNATECSIYKATGIVATGTYTHSAFFKAGTASIVGLEIYENGTNRFAASFTLSGSGSTATIFNLGFTGCSSSIFDVGNGWYRCSITITRSTTTGFSVYHYLSLNSTTAITTTVGTTCYLWGSQLENGGFSTSYIPTTTASTTRSADVCQITGGNFSSIWNGTEGSVAVEYDRLADNSSGLSGGYPTTLAAASSNSAWIILAGSIAPSPVGEVLAVYNSTSQAYFSAGSSPLAGITAKMSACYKANDFAASLNGSAVSTDTSGTVPACDGLGIGYWPYGNAPLNGHIARLRYYNKRLPNATLQQLST